MRVIKMAITIIKEFSPTKITLLCLTNGKEKELTTDIEHPFDYDIIEKIWEDIELE